MLTWRIYWKDEMAWDRSSSSHYRRYYVYMNIQDANRGLIALCMINTLCENDTIDADRICSQALLIV